MTKVKKTWIILGSILLILIIARLMLPYFVTRYVNKVLGEIEGYQGSISDVDIALIRGAYVIYDLKIFKIDGHKKVPFVDIPATDLSVEWSALFKGSIVGEIIFDKPKLNFIGGDGPEKKEGGNDTQTGEDVDWTVPIKKLLPLQINRLEIDHGTIAYYDFSANPKVSVTLDSLQLLATNLNNANRQKERLPSTVNATATSIGGGKFDLTMAINILKQVPDLDMNLKFQGINMPALNDFFLAYSKIDVEKGTFNLFSELVVKDSEISGYVKPVAENVKIVNWEKDKKNPLNLAWQAIVGLLAEFFENQKENQFATKVPLQGNLKDIQSGVWPTIWNVFRNGFVKAFEKNTDNSIQFNNTKTEPEDPKEKKKEDRKERRKERREEKREERKEKKEENAKEN
jgi:hypothetical protein